MRDRWLPILAHAVPVSWLFAGALFGGRLPYFRDISSYYYPNYVFLEQSLRDGIWPLWNPTCDAGAPFLMSYPIDLLLVGLLGAEGALRFDGPLHLLLAMAGASILARTLGLAPVGVWAAGLFYGLSGYVLSTVNLLELFHATAWGPWVVAAFVDLWKRPGPAGAARLGLAGAVQIATLGAETVLQSGLFGLILLRERPDRRRGAWTAASAALSLLLAAPALLGAGALVEGSARAQGLAPSTAFAWSLHPVALLDIVLPRFFGDVHTFSDRGYWGQPFFTEGYPYVLSLYLGPGVVWLALGSGPSPERRRLWAIAALGVVLALGTYGPAEWALQPFMRHFRVPAKFLLLTTLAVCLLAARGVSRAADAGARVSRAWLVPGLALAAAYPILANAPDLPGHLLGAVVPEILDSRARFVITSSWPTAFGVTGALLLAQLVALRLRRGTVWAAAFAGLDLLVTNGDLNRFASRSFYELRPEVQALMREARAGSDARWFSYAVAGTPGLAWSPEVARRNSDVWLYYMDRQSLMPRTHVLDGVDGAFAEDVAAWAPAHSTLAAAERTPAAFPHHYRRLKEASVRWILSFRALPEDLTVRRGEVRLPEVLESLKLYELRDAWPRAFWVDHLGPHMAPGGESVTWERIDAHTVRLRVSAPAGYVVFTEGFHRSWRVEDAAGRPRPIREAGERYWAIATGGGTEVLTARYVPGWRLPAVAACGLGLAGALALMMAPRRRP